MKFWFAVFFALILPIGFLALCVYALIRQRKSLRAQMGTARIDELVEPELYVVGGHITSKREHP